MKEFTKEHTLQVKGVAIMLLLFYHLFHEEEVLEKMQVNYAPLSTKTMLNLAGFGNVCVAIFVMLTAYGLTKMVLSMENATVKSLCASSVKRLGRLMMSFFAVYLSINVICFTIFDYGKLYGSGKQGVLFMLCDAFGLSSILKTPMLNETWWYMKIAYILIFLVPFLTLLIKKTGNTLLLLAFFAPFVVIFDGDIERYLFVAVFGVCAAYGNWQEKIISKKVPAIVWWLIGIVGMPLVVLIRQNAVVKDYFWNYVDALIAFFIICITVLTVGKVPVLNKILAFIGKHSMNIFLMHTFLYLIVWRKYVYYFEYAFASFFILLLASLIYSVILELLKSLIGKIVKKLWKKQSLL